MVDFDVVELPETDHVGERETAPDFTRPLVNDEFWEDVALSELTAEGRVVLVFTAMDGAFPATYAWKELAKRRWDEEYDATVVGLSISTPYEHKSLIEERDLPYSLFSDPANGVAEAYGIVNDLDGMAHVSEPRPAVYVLDADRTVEYAWVADEWPAFPDYDEVEAALDRA
jgi:peroxiredoxin